MAMIVILLCLLSLLALVGMGAAMMTGSFRNQFHSLPSSSPSPSSFLLPNASLSSSSFPPSSSLFPSASLSSSSPSPSSSLFPSASLSSSSPSPSSFLLPNASLSSSSPSPSSSLFPSASLSSSSFPPSSPSPTVLSASLPSTTLLPASYSAEPSSVPFTPTMANYCFHQCVFPAQSIQPYVSNIEGTTYWYCTPSAGSVDPVCGTTSTSYFDPNIGSSGAVCANSTACAQGYVSAMIGYGGTPDQIEQLLGVSGSSGIFNQWQAGYTDASEAM